MPTFTGKTFSSFYKNLLGLNQSSNTGVDATTRVIHDGAGQSTSISLSDDVLQVQPISDDSSSTFTVKDQGGNIILSVDTSNKVVKAGASRINALTQYAYFGINSADSAAFGADVHYTIPFVNGTGDIAMNMGSSTSSSFNDTDPSSSVVISSAAANAATAYWHILEDITIDSVRWLHGADAATGDSNAAHLMAYTVDIGNGSTSGDLSSGVVVADGANITNAGYEQLYYQQMTIRSADVDAGKVILFTFASDTVNSDYSINATVKYHIR